MGYAMHARDWTDWQRYRFCEEVKVDPVERK